MISHVAEIVSNSANTAEGFLVGVLFAGIGAGAIFLSLRTKKHGASAIGRLYWGPWWWNFGGGVIFFGFGVTVIIDGLVHLLR